ncbi:hypothetical protein C1704_16235 [Caldimonas caldifontis]|uniref:Uncharacterized protein n=2 Tax=Caldimonas caldifontis TaxID=1452508 RepID=A0A2S5SQP7_9BURK|nr:hypothetical protein C1704_16235 [Caldimonas caldifontis]
MKQHVHPAWRLLQALAAVELLSALLLPGRYLFPYHRLQCLRDDPIDEWCLHPWQVVGDLYSIAFIVVPAVALIAALRRQWLTLPLLVVTPALLFLSGIGAFPLLLKLVPIGEARTAALLSMNAAAAVLAVFLYRKAADVGASTLGNLAEGGPGERAARLDP